MTNSLPPALTSDEWRIWREEGHVRSDFFSKGIGFRGVPRISVNVAPMDVEAHACAALCLYDQPYGFTQEDVKLLEDFNQYHDRPKLSDGRRYVEVAMSEDDFVLLRSLVARITALLPPE